MSINIVLSVKDTCRGRLPDVGNLEHGQWDEEEDLLSMYSEQYTMAALKAIAGYYSILVCGRRKAQLAEQLVRYERDPSNQEEVARRRGLWSAAELLKSDPFFNTRLILDC